MHKYWKHFEFLHQGLIEFLLDRGAEPNKECTECKFRIVEKLVECNKESKFGDIWTPSVIAQLKGHAQEGPWFIRAQASVAFESGPWIHLRGMLKIFLLISVSNVFVRHTTLANIILKIILGKYTDYKIGQPFFHIDLLPVTNQHHLWITLKK